MDTNENVLEFYTGEKTMLCTFTQRKWITKCTDLANKFPEEVQIISKNKDGSIVVKMPTKYLHITRYNRTGSFGKTICDSELEVCEE